MAIYTKVGDRGETSLFKKLAPISKDSVRINAIGAVDEANSYLGVIISESTELKKPLNEIQKNLFVIGSILAGARLRFSKTKTKKLEIVIDRLEGNLPTLKNFILPGGGKIGAKLLFARALLRRAERAVVSLNSVEEVKPGIMVYLNRLSDYLFMIAREVNFKEGFKEEVWKGSSK
ncbi:cob(I)yrinic acid a,c-diamide adenosyltransferase [Candidatus Woesebacteria bacterium]|nr:cob(I)yrinic acid a,c-diamide adenosyltransferase [Candidatus Woesebacteria bacterium]